MRVILGIDQTEIDCIALVHDERTGVESIHFFAIQQPAGGKVLLQVIHRVLHLVNGDRHGGDHKRASLGLNSRCRNGRLGGRQRARRAGYEFQRKLRAEVDSKTVNWTERVQVIRSRDLARRQTAQLEERLTKAEAALRALTPEPGRGKRQYRDEGAFQAAIAEVVAGYRVAGLLNVAWQRQEKRVTRYVGRGRGGPQRPQRTEIKVRYVVTAVARDEEAIAKQRHRLGWRVQVTNMPMERLTLTQAAIHYRGGWCLERDFPLIKDRPLGISPLYVRKHDQIIGLTRLLSLALRLLTLIETQVRHSLARAKETLVGLYEGQPNRATDSPTASRLLKAFTRAEITLTRVELGGRTLWHITPLSGLLDRILEHLGLHKSLYESLADNSS